MRVSMAKETACALAGDQFMSCLTKACRSNCVANDGNCQACRMDIYSIAMSTAMQTILFKYAKVDTLKDVQSSLYTIHCNIRNKENGKLW